MEERLASRKQQERSHGAVWIGVALSPWGGQSAIALSFTAAVQLT
jgi:hypothetical protein